MVRLIKQLFCEHDYKFYANLYGDSTIRRGMKRSVWKCTKCGKIEYRDYLYHPDENINVIEK